MSKKHKYIIDNDLLRIILVVSGSIFSVLVLFFSVLAIVELEKPDLQTASLYLLGVFITLGCSRLITFFKDRSKINFIRFLSLFIFDVVLGILVLFGKDNPYFFSLAAGLYCVSIILSRLFKIIKDHSIRSIVLNAIIIFFATLLAIGLFIPYQNGSISDVVLIVCVLIAISAFVEVFSNATSQMHIKVLIKIVVRTFALEVILGLLTIMVAFSLIFMLYEPEIPTFADGLWYSFAVVTTIGFGDIKAVTVLGRVLTVILGIYGIIVVAVITSIIVNFYNESVGKHDSEEIKNINQETKKENKK